MALYVAEVLLFGLSAMAFLDLGARKGVVVDTDLVYCAVKLIPWFPVVQIADTQGRCIPSDGVLAGCSLRIQ